MKRGIDTHGAFGAANDWTQFHHHEREHRKIRQTRQKNYRKTIKYARADASPIFARVQYCSIISKRDRHSALQTFAQRTNISYLFCECN